MLTSVPRIKCWIHAARCFRNIFTAYLWPVKCPWVLAALWTWNDEKVAFYNALFGRMEVSDLSWNNTVVFIVICNTRPVSQICKTNRKIRETKYFFSLFLCCKAEEGKPYKYKWHIHRYHWSVTVLAWTSTLGKLLNLRGNLIVSAE